MTMQIVSDLKTLRTLAEYLLILDPVTFLGYLENLRAAESINSIWLFHDAAHSIFEQVCFCTAPPPCPPRTCPWSRSIALQGQRCRSKLVSAVLADVGLVPKPLT